MTKDQTKSIKTLATEAKTEAAVCSLQINVFEKKEFLRKLDRIKKNCANIIEIIELNNEKDKNE